MQKSAYWQWTSLHDYVAKNSSVVALNDVINRFGSIDNFRSWRERMVEALPEYDFLDKCDPSSRNYKVLKTL